MKKLKVFAVLVGILFMVSGQAFSDGYITPTYSVPYNFNPNIPDVKVIAYDWCSVAGGTASITLTSKLYETVKGYCMYQVDTAPYPALTDAVAGDIAGFTPTDNYDLYLRGMGWLDISDGELVDRDSNYKETVKSINYIVNEPFGIWLSATGNITKGRIWMYFLPVSKQAR